MEQSKLIEIRDPDVDEAEVWARVQARVAQRRAALGTDSPQFPVYSSAAQCPDPPEGLPYAFSLYRHLQRANASYGRVETQPNLAASNATRVPLLGRLWQMIRSEAHNLVLFYVNRFVQHQVKVNYHLVSTLNELVRENEAQKRRIMALQVQLQALQDEGRAHDARE